MSKKSYKSSPAAYPDVEKVLAEARRRGSLIIRFDRLGKAINFTQRCYRYRSALRDLIFEQNGSIPGLPVETPYDDMIISYIEKEPGKRQSKAIYINFYGSMLPEEIIDPESGENISLDVKEGLPNLIDPEDTE